MWSAVTSPTAGTYWSTVPEADRQFVERALAWAQRLEPLLQPDAFVPQLSRTDEELDAARKERVAKLAEDYKAVLDKEFQNKEQLAMDTVRCTRSSWKPRPLLPPTPRALTVPCPSPRRPRPSGSSSRGWTARWTATSRARGR